MTLLLFTIDQSASQWWRQISPSHWTMTTQRYDFSLYIDWELLLRIKDKYEDHNECNSWIYSVSLDNMLETRANVSDTNG